MGQMSSGLTSISNTPVMHYRPDPGEPAVRLSAKEQQTAGLVTLQEQRNETRLRSRAMVRGEDVIYSNRTFSLGVGSVSPTYNGGLTTVVTRTDGNGFLPNTVVQQSASDEKSADPTEEAENKENTDAMASDPLTELQSAVQPTPEELDEKKQDIESENKQIERNLLKAQLEMDRAYQNGNPLQAQQADRKQTDLERQKEENEKEKRDIVQKQAQQKGEETGSGIGQIGKENLTNASSLLEILFGKEQDPQQPVLQYPSTPDIPRFSFAR